VYVLDKGFNKQLFEQDIDLVETGAPTVLTKGDFLAGFRRDLLVTLTQLTNETFASNSYILDARSADRYHARAKETRPGLVSGHIPHAFNVPYGTVLKDKSILPPEELKQLLSGKGVDVDSKKPFMTTCGSGISAAILALALDSIDIKAALYDGSWSEYGQESLHNKVSTE